MAWSKIDDQFFFHPKVLAAGRDARDVYLAGLTYSAGQLTDGFIPDGAAALIGAMAQVESCHECAAKLVEVGLWERVNGGYMIHDYLDYNPSGEKVRAIRKARQEAGRIGGERSRPSKQDDQNDEAKLEAKPEANGKQNRTPSPSPSPSPSPVPVPTELGSADAPPALDDLPFSDFEPEPEPEPEPASKKRRSRADPRTKHPAIQAVRHITGKLPPKVNYAALIKALGDDPDEDKMRRCLEAWTARGYNPRALTPFLEWYHAGVPSNGRASPADVGASVDAALRSFANGDP